MRVCGLSELKKPLPETIDFCKILSTKGEDEIYYLTDLTQPEKEKIIKWLTDGIRHWFCFYGTAVSS